MIREILILLFNIFIIIGIVYSLYNISKGEYQKTEYPIANAISIIINLLILIGFWLYIF
jgi:hypothetical protein